MHMIQYLDHVQWSINILEAKMISSRTDETPDEKKRSLETKFPFKENIQTAAFHQFQQSETVARWLFGIGPLKLEQNDSRSPHLDTVDASQSRSRFETRGQRR